MRTAVSIARAAPPHLVARDVLEAPLDLDVLAPEGAHIVAGVHE